MTMPAPTLAYDVGTQPMITHGLSYQGEQVSEMLAGPINDSELL
ncbi:hypothetical protein [Vibrio parahaemolyticus]|nr:hypothetical protein [Vibrio parahaemolyticus]